MYFHGIGPTMKELRDAVRALETEAVNEVKKAARVVQSNLYLNTPVWSGETIRNYVWNIGGRATGPKRSPLGIPPPLGRPDEHNRAANESAASSEMESILSFTKLVNLTVTNLISPAKWDLIDNGAAPTPQRSRYPGGVSVLTMQSARLKLGNWK